MSDTSRHYDHPIRHFHKCCAVDQDSSGWQVVYCCRSSSVERAASFTVWWTCGAYMSNFISSASDRKEKSKKITQLHNTTQRNEKHRCGPEVLFQDLRRDEIRGWWWWWWSTNFRTYSWNSVCQVTSISNGATDRTSIKCHKIYKDNRESLNNSLKRLIKIVCSLCWRRVCLTVGYDYDA